MYDSPEDALRAAVTALGGPKKAGVMLWPQLEDQPDKAGRKLADHLNEERAEKLSLAQVVFLFRRAQVAGFHEGMYAWNRMCGYSPSKPLDDGELLAKKQQEAIALMEQLRATQEEMERLLASSTPHMRAVA